MVKKQSFLETVVESQNIRAMTSQPPLLFTGEDTGTQRI